MYGLATVTESDVTVVWEFESTMEGVEEFGLALESSVERTTGLGVCERVELVLVLFDLELISVGLEPDS